MSSAISTKVLPPEGGSYKAGVPPDSRGYRSRGFRLQAEDKADKPEGFRVWHFFVLLALLASTVAVVLARQVTPESLILMSLTIGAAGAAAIGFYRMLAPLTAHDAELIVEPLSDRLRADLEREKALTLRTIKELEFDRAMGKLSPQDFDEMAGRLRARALGIMKQIDAGAGAYRAVIERELAARMGNKPASEARDLKVPPTGSVPPAGSQVRCACGASNDPDARFCKSCGAKLTRGAQGA